MSDFVTVCRNCGAEFEPSKDAMRAGSWRRCPTCSPAAAEPHQCRECGRPLRVTSRPLFARCLGIA